MKTRAQIFSLFVVNFLSSFGFSLVILSLVVFVEKFGGNSVIYGLISAIYPLFQFLGSPFLGRLSDSVGRRPILLISQIGAFIAWIIYGTTFFLPLWEIVVVKDVILGTFVITLPLLCMMVSRAIEGFMAGNVAVAQAYIADAVSNEERSQYYGKLAIASNLGLIVGPAIAGLMSEAPNGEYLPIYIAIAISLISIISIYRYLPESLQKKERQKITPAIVNEVLVIKPIRYIVSIYFAAFFAFNIYYTSFPLYAKDFLGWRLKELGIYFSSVAIGMAIIQGPVLTALSKRFSDAQRIIIGSIILSGNFFLIPLGTRAAIYFGALLFAIGNGIMWPSFLAFLSKSSHGKDQGMVQGIAGAAGSIASVFGLIIGGVAFDKYTGNTFYISAAVFCIVVLLVIRLPYIQKRYNL